MQEWLMVPSVDRVALSRVIVCLAAFVAVLPMLVNGPSCGHDFDFHLLSWLEAANQFAHHDYPRWAYTPGWNAGEPRFVFYPPLSWALGGILGLLLPWTLVPAAFTWLALAASGLTMHRLASRYTSPFPAALAGTLYLANPYMLFTAYERTAYGELMAAAWIPLLFAAIFPRQTSVRLRIVPVAIAVALLWLTNAPAAVMGSYALAFVTLVRLVAAPSRMQLAARTTAGTMLGFALAAFFIVPAAYEQRFVQINMAIIPGMRVQDHFLFHRMGSSSFDDLFHDHVVHTASVVALALLVAICMALAAARRIAPAEDADKPRQTPLLPLALLALLIAFLLSPPSLVLWQHLPKLAFLQFPWRLNALLGAILGMVSAGTLARVRLSAASCAAASLALACALVLPCWSLFHQRCDAEDTVPARVALFHTTLGTEATDEYTPAAVDGDALQPHNPPWWTIPATASADPDAPASSGAAPGQAPDNAPGQAPDHLVLSLASPTYLVLNRRWYPAWRIRVNGQRRNGAVYHRADGLIELALPAGTSTIDLSLTEGEDQIIGLAVSNCAWIIAVLLARRRRTA